MRPMTRGGRSGGASALGVARVDSVGQSVWRRCGGEGEGEPLPLFEAGEARARASWRCYQHGTLVLVVRVSVAVGERASAYSCVCCLVWAARDVGQSEAYWQAEMGEGEREGLLACAPCTLS